MKISAEEALAKLQYVAQNLNKVSEFFNKDKLDKIQKIEVQMSRDAQIENDEVFVVFLITLHYNENYSVQTTEKHSLEKLLDILQGTH